MLVVGSITRTCSMLIMCILIALLGGTRAAATLPGGSVGLSCSQHFTLHNNFCYRYFGPEVRKGFHHAQKQCSRYQSALVSLHSPEEEQFVVRLAYNQSAFWIGLNDEDGPAQVHREGVFKWSFGEEEFHFSSSYCRWKEGEPANRRHLDCVKVDSEGWAMAPGGCAASKLPFVCKKQACPMDLCGSNSAEVADTAIIPILLFLGLMGLLMVAALFCLQPKFGKTTDVPSSLDRTKQLPQELYPT